MLGKGMGINPDAMQASNRGVWSKKTFAPLRKL